MQFYPLDVVVWNGIITYYQIIAGKIPEDEITLATDIDISKYCNESERNY